MTPLEILYRDEHLVAVNKPGGVLVHRSRESADREVLLQTLAGQIGAYLYPVHRLDRAASGALLFGLSSEAARGLQAALGAEDARKEYLALVRGLAPEQGESRRPLTSDKGVQQEAWTEFERVAVLAEGRLSLLRVRTHTGRRHQIRRHLAHLRHQILGDTTYGKGRLNSFYRETYGLPRLFLHACLIEIRHPFEGGVLTVRASLARDLRGFLERLPGVPRDALAGI